MMNKKVTISTDWHFGKSNGKFDHIILEGILEQCKHAKQNNIKIMFNLGDTLDTKQTISTSTLNYLAKAFIAINETFEKIYILVGNHDLRKKTYDNQGHNLHIFSGYPNIKIIDQAKIIDIFEKKIYMLPYFPNEIIKNHKFLTADYLMGHIEIQGFMLNRFIEAKEGIHEDLIIDKYKKIFLGHFHKRQVKGKIKYIGSLCRFFYGEDNEERGWTVLDFETGNDEFIEYQHPRMYKFKMSKLKEMEDKLGEIFRNGDNLKLILDQKYKYSEIEEFKSKLILNYGINELVLDDQMSLWDNLDLEDNENFDEEDIKEKFENQSYSNYIIDNLIRTEKLNNDHEAIKYLRELAKIYQE